MQHAASVLNNQVYASILMSVIDFLDNKFSYIMTQWVEVMQNLK